MAKSVVGILILLSAASLAVPARARAADVPPEEEAAAIFDQAVALMSRGKFAEACAKFAKSQELAPTGGTLLALADCHEKNGQPAAAWAAYKGAAERAATAKQPVPERTAREAMKRLDAKLSRVTIDATSMAGTEGLVVKIDGRVLGAAEIGSPLPVDPGVHVVEARAPRRTAWETSITIGQRPTSETLVVPELHEAKEPAPVVAPPIPEPSEATPSGHTQRVSGVVVAGVGVAALAVGAAFGLQASAKNDEAASHCRDEVRCTAEGMRLHEETRDAATVSTIGFVLGGLSLAAGAVLYLAAPRATATAPAVTFGARATAAGGFLGVSGRF